MEQFVAAYNAHASIMGWSSRLTLVLSAEDEYVHIHALLESTPGWTAFHWIRDYWHMRYGQVHPDVDELYNPGGYTVYCDRQAIKTIVVTCNWPQNQTPNLTGNLSKAVPSVYCPYGNSVYGINSNSRNNAFFDLDYPLPVYDADSCCPHDEPPELDSFPADFVGEFAAEFAADLEYHGNGITVQAWDSLAHFDDDNYTGVNLLSAYESCNMGDIGMRGGESHVRDNLDNPRRRNTSLRPGCHAAIPNVATATTPPRAGPPRAAPDSVSPAA